MTSFLVTICLMMMFILSVFALNKTDEIDYDQDEEDHTPDDSLRA